MHYQMPVTVYVSFFAILYKQDHRGVQQRLHQCRLDIDSFVNNEAHAQRTKPLLASISLDVCLQHTKCFQLEHEVTRLCSK